MQQWNAGDLYAQEGRARAALPAPYFVTLRWRPRPTLTFPPRALLALLGYCRLGLGRHLGLTRHAASMAPRRTLRVGVGHAVCVDFSGYMLTACPRSCCLPRAPPRLPQYTMRVLQGSIVGSSFLIMAIGYTGAMGALLRFLSPVVVAPTVCMVGRGMRRGLRRQGAAARHRHRHRPGVAVPRVMSTHAAHRAADLLPPSHARHSSLRPSSPSLARTGLLPAT